MAEGVHSVTDHANIVRNGLYGDGPHDKREAAFAALDALIAERNEARAQLRAATDLIVTAEKIAPGITQTASAFAIGDVYEARQRAEAAETREAQLREAIRDRPNRYAADPVMRDWYARLNECLTTSPIATDA